MAADIAADEALRNVALYVIPGEILFFSALLNISHEIRLTDDESLEKFKIEGNVATLPTKRPAIVFNANTGKWADIDRFQPDR